MHILYFHQHFNTPDGAGGTRSYAMARRLIERGHQVTVVCGSYSNCRTGLIEGFRHGQRRGVVDGIGVIEFDLPYSNRHGFIKRTWTFIRFALRSISLVLILNYDLVFATSTPLTASIPGICAHLFRHKPFVFEVRDLWPELPREMGVITNPLVLRLMDWLEWLSYHAAQGCIGLSPGIVAGIQRRGIPANRVVMIPNGCELDLFASQQPYTRPEGVLESDLLCVFTGAHGLANGLDGVLDAADELKRRGRVDIKLLFVGDGKLKPKLIIRAVQDELHNCLFLDPLPNHDLTRLLQVADVGLMILANVPAFYYGTSPNKFFDYIATGLPVFNNYPGWLAELIERYHCGLVVPPENPKAFADALEYMADHREELAQMGRNARTLAEREFDRQQLSDHFVDMIESVAWPTRTRPNTPDVESIS